MERPPRLSVRPTSRSSDGAAAPNGASAVGYLRRSTDRQEQSIGDQKAVVERFAAENGLRLSHFYVDDAISGTSAIHRAAFQEMVADAQKPTAPFRYVVVYDVKRFGRLGNDEAGYYRHILTTHGVEVLYATENFSGDGTDDLLRPVKQWQAREESKDLSKVTIRGLLSKSAHGCWLGGTPPYGYDLAYETGGEGGSGNGVRFLLTVRFLPDGGKEILDEKGRFGRRLERGEALQISKRDRARLIPSHPDRVAVIERIFRMSAEENRGLAAISATLNAERVPTPRGPEWARIYAGTWSSSTVRAILVNPLYVGDFVWNRRTDARFHKISRAQATERKDPYGARLVPNPEEDWIRIPDTHPPLVSRRIFELARTVRESRATSKAQRGQNPRVTGGWTGQRARFLLSGLIQCARCGGRYEGCVRTKGRKRTDGSSVKTYYYGCGSYVRRGRAACRFGPVAQTLIEDEASKAVVQFYERYQGDAGRKELGKVVLQIVGSESHDLGEAKRRAVEEREKIQKTIETLLDNLTPENRTFVDERLAKLGKEREAIERRIEELERLSVAAIDVQATVGDVRLFIAGLAEVLASGTPDQRVQAIRRSVERIDFDAEAQVATVRAWRVPLTGLQKNDTEPLSIRLTAPPSSSSSSG